MVIASRITNSFSINLMFSAVVFLLCVSGAPAVFWGVFVVHLLWVLRIIYR